MNNSTKYPYLSDSSFLQKVTSLHLKEQFVKIVVLNFAEEPLQEIQGVATGGSINLDGNSSIRRTCNLSLIATEDDNDLTNIDNMLSLNKKVSIEIGFTNTTGEYTEFDKIWFPQGVFVIMNPSLTHDTTGVRITLQLKDKMVLLNGECGGTIPASTVFHQYDTVDKDGNIITIQPIIYKIIQECVNHFGGEQLAKIVISDVDARVKQVMKWTGSTPLYIIKKIKGEVIQYIPTVNESDVADQEYQMYESGSEIGYKYIDFVYPGELIGDAGSTVCDILDKIKNTLGNFEYFYDIDGVFHFQEIKNYLNTTQAKVEMNKLLDSDYILDLANGKAVYVFNDSTIITSYTNTPQYSMIKNDFVVWGMRKTANEQTVPIRYHLAIDEKPEVGNTYHCFLYEDPSDGIVKAKCPIYHENQSEFPQTGAEEQFYYSKRDNRVFQWDGKNKKYIDAEVTFIDITTQDWRSELYLQGAAAEPLGVSSNYYYTELLNEWTKLYNLEEGAFKEDILRNESQIDFFLDFISSDKLNISNIGRRSKVVVDDSVNCVFEPEIPDLILLENGSEDTATLRQECEEQGQDYIQLDSNMYSTIEVSSGFNSAYNLVRELLYQYTSYNESITLSLLPIYYLEPNIRITVNDSESGIHGDYMIHNISIPLDITSTATVSCTKVLDRI